MSKISFKLGNKMVGSGFPVLVVAEVSANHNGSFKRAKEIVKTACQLGAGAVKLQTYTADTLTLNSKKESFQVRTNPAWKGRTLHELYTQGYMPWEWHEKLKKIAASYNVPLFSTAYDNTAVDFLEKLGVPAYKIASFELTDLELLKRVAKTKKPVIISRGMSTLIELRKAVKTLRENGTSKIAILHCVNSYPAKAEELNLATIPDIKKKFGVVTGLSSHYLGISDAIASVVLGASIIEKHFTLSRSDGGLDASFSLEPKEFEELVRTVKDVEKAIGKVFYNVGKSESENIVFRRSLWVIKPIKKGEKFTTENIGRFRPGNGLAIKYLPKIIGKIANLNVKPNTPMNWSLVKK